MGFRVEDGTPKSLGLCLLFSILQWIRMPTCQ